MMQALQEAGWPAYVVIAAGLVGLLVALAALGAAFGARERQTGIGLSILAIVAGIATLGIGALGYVLQMRSAFEAVAFVDASMRAALLAQAISEAMNNLVFGGVCGALPFLLGFVALVRSVTRARPASRVRGD